MMVAKELMSSHVIKIDANATIGQAVELLREHTISGLPVTDAQGRLIGVITGGDVLRAIQQKAQKIYHSLFGPTQVVIDENVWKEDSNRLLNLPVEKMMSRSPFTVQPQTPVGEIADLMIRQNIRRVFVLEHDKLVGIITRNDIVRWLVRHVG
ncbi:CBS domain-containing protein [Sulfobacillus thermosulfidooxidans]|uniref:CBS domain-containing protein n=1 Tax=Sulfobacillus thermosulfidooxidans TaxID=28034 RepID=UPI001FA94182|nr:CBS domain-containing protein [Sulfobacillus thermosulfidooxidans]